MNTRSWLFNNADIKPVLRIRIRMDPHHFGKLDPDLPQSGKLDPNPHQSEKKGSGSASKCKGGSLGGSFWSIEGPNLEKVSGRIRIRINLKDRIRIRIKLKGRVRDSSLNLPFINPHQHTVYMNCSYLFSSVFLFIMKKLTCGILLG